MTEPRIAFTAEFWGPGAVVCRATEDCPGPSVEQEFGVFETWTAANTFASKLNEGLEISSQDATQVVLSAMLARADVLRAAAETFGHVQRCLNDTDDAQIGFLRAWLDLSKTIHRMATASPAATRARTMALARMTQRYANECLLRISLNDFEREELRDWLSRSRGELRGHRTPVGALAR